MDQLPRLGKRELICLLLFTFSCVVSVRRGFLFLWVLVMVYVILLWHSLSLPYNYFVYCRELAPSTVSLTSNRVRGDSSKHYAIFTCIINVMHLIIICILHRFVTQHVVSVESSSLLLHSIKRKQYAKIRY